MGRKMRDGDLVLVAVAGEEHPAIGVILGWEPEDKCYRVRLPGGRPEEVKLGRREVKRLELRDVVKTCWTCGREFLLLAGEQAFCFREGLKLPGRCRSCRKAATATITKAA